jgi:hypothetical protein
MYMRAWQPRRVRAFELGHGNPFGIAGGYRGAFLAAEEDRLIGQARDNGQAGLEILGMLGDDHDRVRRQRIGVDRGDEDRARTGLRVRHIAEWARAQCGPEPGGEQAVHNCVACKRDDLPCLICREELFILSRPLDDDGLQRPAIAVGDRSDKAARRRGDFDHRTLAVLEQGLSEADPIPFVDQKPGHDPPIILTEKPHGGRVAQFRDPRLGRSANLDIQTLANPEALDRYRLGHGSSMSREAPRPRLRLGPVRSPT